MQFEFAPKGVCAKKMVIDIDGDIVKSVQIVGGCHGNSQGISSLVRDMKVSDVIQRLEGIKCGFKSSSCPDQLAKALKEYTEK